MCGIVGYAGSRPAAPVLIRALHDLEYRGYDSAGIALLESSDGGGNHLVVTKREGKIANRAAAVDGDRPSTATTGIGHTRWATHGKPSDTNAHPHLSCNGEVVVIHNGIVENYAELRARLVAAGHRFTSETDTETIAHLLEEEMAGGASLVEALGRSAGLLLGSQALVAMSPSDPGAVVAARVGNAGGVVVGYGDGETLVASDLAALLQHTRRVGFLSDGQMVRITISGPEYFALDGSPARVEPRETGIDAASAQKGAYEHFMLKEIMEQPEALSDTIRSLVTLQPAELHLEHLGEAGARLAQVERVILVGMGTSLHAAMIGRLYFERLAGVPAESTKCFTTALVALYALALRLGQARGHLSATELAERVRELSYLPGAAGRAVGAGADYRALARHFADSAHFLYLGRGFAFPVALEGALKMKEISYIHAEGYAAGEMKHGPIALIDPSFPTVAVATRHALRAKIISNIEQIQARAGEVLVVGTEGDDELARLADHFVAIPAVPELLEPIVATATSTSPAISPRR
jgi:glucosamine 6-phosphate synthetase-like amidotransferase/phosphosugar isomerase protein